MIDEQATATLGSMYSINANITVLTQAIKSGSNTEIAELDKKRLIIFTEPNDGDMLQIGNIKRLTGCGTFNARAIYSTKTDTSMFGTIILECNKKPRIIGAIDESVVSRFVNVNFPTFFTNDEDELKLDYAKPLNKYLKTDEFKTSHRCAFFKYIVNHGKNELYVPKDIKAATYEYLINNDEFGSWFSERYKQRNGHFITVKQLYSDFKCSSYYDDLPKIQKRALNEKNFKEEQVMANIKLKKYYSARKQIDGIERCSIIYNYTKIEKDIYGNEIDYDTEGNELVKDKDGVIIPAAPLLF